jgi:hypothetical protein
MPQPSPASKTIAIGIRIRAVSGKIAAFVRDSMALPCTDALAR